MSSLIIITVAILLVIGLRRRKTTRRRKAKTWREAAKREGAGRIMYDGLREELNGVKGQQLFHFLMESCRRSPVTHNLPTRTIRYIHEEALKGRRAKGIAEDLQKEFPKLAKDELEVITRSVVSRASTALTRARAEDLGCHWYIWRSAKDIRVRETHRLLEGVLVAWTDPPDITGGNHAGEEDECRCYCEPILRLDQVQWPAKACTEGQIETVKKSHFKRMQLKDSILK